MGVTIRNLTGSLLDASSGVTTGAVVSVSILGPTARGAFSVSGETLVVKEKVEQEVDDDGFFSIGLIPNEFIIPPDTQYRVVVRSLDNVYLYSKIISMPDEDSDLSEFT